MKSNNVNIITKILWVCIAILIALIAFRLLQRLPVPASLQNIKQVLTEKTLPALKSAEQDIFPEKDSSSREDIEDDNL